MRGHATPKVRIRTALLVGLVAGAAFGATELALRLTEALDPHPARRAGALLSYAVGWYGLAGSLLFAAAAGIARLGFGRGRFFARGGLCHRLWRPRAAFVLAIGLLFASGQMVLQQRSLHQGSAEHDGLAGSAPGKRANLILFLVEGLEPEDLSCYGGALPTPYIDELADRGALFERALDRSPWTLAWVVSLLTLCEPLAQVSPTLRARAAACENLWPLERSMEAVGYRAREARLAPPFEAGLCLSKLLTRVVEIVRPGIGAFWPPVLRRDANGFPFVQIRSRDPLEDIVFRARESAWPVPGSPNFLCVRFPSPASTEGPGVQRIDSAIGRLLSALDGSGFLEESYVILTSDPSRLLHAHARPADERNARFATLTHVPLLLGGPGIPPGTRVRRPVDLADLASTLRVVAGAELPRSAIGSDLLDPSE